MAHYNLPDLSKELVIEGHAFSVSIGDVTPLMTAQALVDKLRGVDLKVVAPDVYGTLCDDLISAIDAILGEGASARIFSGRSTNIIGLVGVLMFVIRETAGGDLNGALETALADLTATVEED